MNGMVATIKARLRRLSLARKLTALGVVASTVSLVIASAALIAYDVSSSRERLVRDTEMLADLVSANSTAALAFGDAKAGDRKSTRLNSSHANISYAVFC